MEPGVAHFFLLLCLEEITLLSKMLGVLLLLAQVGVHLIPKASSGKLGALFILAQFSFQIFRSPTFSKFLLCNKEPLDTIFPLH